MRTLMGALVCLALAPAAALSQPTLPDVPARAYIPTSLPGYEMMGEIGGLEPVDRKVSPGTTDRAYTEFTRENLRSR